MMKNKQKILYLSKRALELIEISSQAVILSSARVLPTPPIVENNISDQANLISKNLDKLFSLSKPRLITRDSLDVVLSSDDYVFTTCIIDNDKDELKAIKKELDGRLSDWLYNSQVFYHPEKKYKSVVLTAIKNQIVFDWQEVLKQNEIAVDDFVPDHFGLIASVEQDGLQAIVDFGDEYSKLFVVLDGKVIWGEKIPFGENKWWRLVDDFKDLKEKEIVKQYGSLFKKPGAKKKNNVDLVNTFDVLCELIQAGLNDFEKFYGQKVERLTLFGRMTGVKGVDIVLSNKLKLSVDIGFCPAKKIKSQNYVYSWGMAKILLTTSIHKIFMARTSNEKHSSIEEDGDKPVATRIKTRLVDAAVHTGHQRPKKSSTMSVTIVLVLLFVLTAASIWFYSNWQGNKPIDVAETQPTITTTQSEVKTVNSDIRFSFFADTVDSSGQRLARTVKVQTNSQATTTDESLALASADLAEDEALWPVMFGNDTWLIYRQPLLRSAAQDYVRSLNQEAAELIAVNSIIPKRISVGKSQNEFLVSASAEIKINGSLTLNLPENPDLLATSTPTSTNPVLQEGELIIANTPAGWANVRSGPGLQNSIVGKVNNGEKYNILEQQNEWYRIKLTTGSEAWVIKKYTNVK